MSDRLSSTPKPVGKGLICVPHTGYFPAGFVVNWAQLLFHTRPLVEQLDFRFVGSSLIYDAREGCAEHMLEKGHDWLFFLDSDMAPPPDIIQRLLSHNVPIVSAVACKRIPPYNPCFYPVVEHTDDGKVRLICADEWTPGLGEVQGVGMACTLIRREVFEQTPRKWFFPVETMGEDLAFCWRARQAGFKVYVDTTIDCDHINQDERINSGHYRAYKEAQESAGKLKVVGA